MGIDKKTEDFLTKATNLWQDGYVVGGCRCGWADLGHHRGLLGNQQSEEFRPWWQERNSGCYPESRSQTCYPRQNLRLRNLPIGEIVATGCEYRKFPLPLRPRATARPK